MTRAELRTYTRKELIVLAKQHRIAGWHPMKKEELIQALVSATRSSRRHQATQSAVPTPKHIQSEAISNGHVSQAKSSANGSRRPSAIGRNADSAAETNGKSVDRLLARVCDPYWLQVRWDISPTMLARAEAALGVDWHQSQLIIRIDDVTSDDTGTTATLHVRDLKLRGDVKHWFVEVDDPSRSYRLQIGYLAPSGRFFAMARSNIVRTSRPGANQAVERDWNADPDAPKKNKLRPSKSRAAVHSNQSESAQPRLSSSRGLAGLGSGAAASSSDDNFEFQIDAELIVSGITHPGAELSLMGTAVPLMQDGRFELRVGLPEGRQVIPAVAVTPNGREERTIVLAIERNTKVLEPHCFDEL